jgi:hypothetical protein
VLKYSLGTLLAVVALVALGCAAWVNFSPAWGQAMFAVAMSLLGVSLIVALVGQGRARVFAAGFAAIGGSYFVLTFLSDESLRDERLVTSRTIDWLYAIQQRAKLGPETTSAPTAMDSGMAMMSGGMSPMQPAGYFPNFSGSSGATGVPVVGPTPAELKDIGHCLWTLVFASLGGLLARGIHGAGWSRERSP